MLRWPVLASIVSMLAPGCSSEEISLGEVERIRELPRGFAVVADIEPASTRNLDLLFVIDNSDSMQTLQEAMRAGAASALVDALDRRFGERPNLHIGVVSTDMGASSQIANCNEQGDSGILQASPGIEGCEAPAGSFLYDIATGTGRETNYTGTLDKALGCIASIGINGCGFEQPLEAMRRALDDSNPENSGFLRDDAMLAVVFLTDEDDCSAWDPTLYAHVDTSLDSPLGPLDSFRCWEFGVRCDEDTPRVPGMRESCAPREDSPYLYSVREYVDFLHELKGPGRVIVAGITGPQGPIEVTRRSNPQGEIRLSLASACESGSTGAVPATRLHTFLRSFPGRNAWSAICESEPEASMEKIAETIVGSATQSRCLFGPIIDQKPEIESVQPECIAYDVRNPGTAAEERIRIRHCSKAEDQEPCFWAAPDSTMCSHTETGLALQLRGELGTLVQGHLQVACAVP